MINKQEKIKNNIEIINSDIETGKIKHALFDFDDTISLFRSNWRRSMSGVMMAAMKKNLDIDSKSAKDFVDNLINQTAGMQTIQQMELLCEEIQKRGGDCQRPEFYKMIYLNDFDEEISEYKIWIKEGMVSREKFMVSGVLPFLKEMHNKGIILHIASGTDNEYLVQEADILGISDFFKSIEGASENFSKRKVTQKIAKEAFGDELIVFGDGFVEIQCAKEVGAISVGVAIDTSNLGNVNKKKRKKLIEAGADIIIPDFSQYSSLLQYLGV